jgi:DNA-binding NtrC family response regulator
LREDLYYRLNVFHISLPPLRDRRQDIPAIAAAQIRDLNRKHNCRVTHLNPEVTRWLAGNSWPGNVRELRNVLERAIIMAGEGEVLPRHLPGAMQPARREAVPQTASDDVLHFPVGAQMSDVEEAYLRLTLKYTNDNKTRAAEILGLSLRTLHNRISEGKTRSAGAD